MSSAATRTRLWWPTVCVIGVVAYVYALGGLYIPHIGDEAPYIEITRLTAESGVWLPLQTAAGLENTKPPALFWLGMVTTGWARNFTLFWLRLPVLLCTLATALLVFLLTRRSGARLEQSYLAGLTFLGFHSSFQYGRPFLTNLPETLFVFLAFALVLFGDAVRERYRLWFVAGLSLGLACLFKSFALIAPVGLALTWYALMLRGWDVRTFFRADLLKIALTGSVALMCFLMWPILDPAPAEILRHFVLEENVGKLGGDGYWQGLVSGPYTLVRLWLGHFGNAGLLAVPLAHLVVVSIRDRASASTIDKGLWIFILSFLIVYSIPSQRQENYLLPTVPALSMLLASRWRSMGVGWFRIGAVPGIAIAAALTFLIGAVRQSALPEGSYAAWQLLLPVVVLAGWLTAAVRVSLARDGFHALVFATYLALSGAIAPFEGPAGRYAPDRVEALSGRTVFVPENFIRKREKHRFLLPGARIEGYDPLDTAALARLLERGRLVVIHRGLAETNTGPYRVLARRLDLTSRHTIGDMWRIAMQRKVELLVRQELVVRRFRQQRERRP